MSFFPLSLSFPSIICLISFFFYFRYFSFFAFCFFLLRLFFSFVIFLVFRTLTFFFPSLSLPLLYRSSSNIHWHLSKLILHFTKPYAKGRWKQVLDEMRIEKRKCLLYVLFDNIRYLDIFISQPTYSFPIILNCR